MNLKQAPLDKVPVLWSVWAILLFASMAAGYYVGHAFVSPSVWQSSGRACPQGWIEVAIGAGLVGSGIFLRRRRRGYGAAVLCGVGLGFVVWPALLILYFKVAPSC